MFFGQYDDTEINLIRHFIKIQSLNELIDAIYLPSNFRVILLLSAIIFFTNTESHITVFSLIIGLSK